VSELYEAWAPCTSVWSRWAKAVLFSFADQANPDPELPAADLKLGELPGSPALVIDLSGPRSVAAGIELSQRGWQPVPLYNALPGPPGVDNTSIDVWSLCARCGHRACSRTRPARRPSSSTTPEDGPSGR
jgi:hypothetical protein